MPKRKVILAGAAGRDFHNFNVFFRNNPNYEVVAFTAEQIPNISKRKYPRELAGKGYPKGIKIYPEKDLPKLIKKFKVDEVVLAYSDLNYIDVMHKSAVANAAGADFKLMGPKSTMLKSKKKVIAVCAVRTGCGKSQTTREICNILDRLEKPYVVVRHPMPYGDLKKQEVQRFATFRDLEKHNVTIEEREEYEPHIAEGHVVYAGVDYGKILEKTEKEADIILWDGGNNDFPFYKPDLHIVLTDPHRPGHEKIYYPGEANLRMADVVLVNKADSASKDDIEIVEKNAKELNPKAKIIEAESEIVVEQPMVIRNKKVLIVEDGPTLTHGQMSFGAGYIAARKMKCDIIDPRKHAVGSIKEIYKKYPHLGKILPAMGYNKKQRKELEKTINKAKCDVVVIGTPIDLRKIMKMNKPAVRIRYKLKERGKPKLEKIVKKYV